MLIEIRPQTESYIPAEKHSAAHPFIDFHSKKDTKIHENPVTDTNRNIQTPRNIETHTHSQSLNHVIIEHYNSFV